MASLPASWKQWVLKCLFAKTPPLKILKILLENGFTFEQAKNALGSNLPDDLQPKRDSAF